MPSSLSSPERITLRKLLRGLRCALSEKEQKNNAEAMVKKLAALPEIKAAKHIAIYWPMDGEIDSRGLMQQHGFANHSFYLPVLSGDENNPLRFKQWHISDELAANKFSIPEPVKGDEIPAPALDVVLMPLTGFDDKGNRLGMGGGFYDRAFAFKHENENAKPLLVGVAHGCQQVDALPNEEWDVSLSVIVTEEKIFRVS